MLDRYSCYRHYLLFTFVGHFSNAFGDVYGLTNPFPLKVKHSPKLRFPIQHILVKLFIQVTAKPRSHGALLQVSMIRRSFRTLWEVNVSIRKLSIAQSGRCHPHLECEPWLQEIVVSISSIVPYALANLQHKGTANTTRNSRACSKRTWLNLEIAWLFAITN